ncbi:Hypothetical predicted protein, partial [Olea europaea subsp. europaea]
KKATNEENTNLNKLVTSLSVVERSMAIVHDWVLDDSNAKRGVSPFAGSYDRGECFSVFVDSERTKSAREGNV